MNPEHPLISVIVLTYNSANFVAETLNSIYKQTYQNYELIIADDYSADNTIEICRLWVEKHPELKNRCKIIIPEKNTGTAANCNRGIKASNGKWIKMIAGDDVLLPNCLKNNIEFCESKNADICFSKLMLMTEAGEPVEEDAAFGEVLTRFFQKNQVEKKLAYLKNPIFLNVPTEFFSRKLFDRVNGFDERIPLLEDQPFFYRVLNAGFDLYFIDCYTVKYRRHDGSVIFNNNFRQDVFKAFDFYRKEPLKHSLQGRIISVLEKSLLNDRKNKTTDGFFYRIKSKVHYELTKI